MDGKPVQVIGELVLHPTPSPLLWYGLAGVLLVAGVLGGAANPVTVSAALATVAALLALFAGLAERSVVPTAAGGTLLTVALPALGLAAGAAALGLKRPPVRVIAVLAAVAVTVGWVLFRLGALGKALPLSSLSPALAKALIAAALGLAVAAAVVAVRSGSLAVAPLDDDEGGLARAVKTPTGDRDRSR